MDPNVLRWGNMYQLGKQFVHQKEKNILVDNHQRRLVAENLQGNTWIQNMVVGS
jgi:hypothetical protein